MLGRWGDKPQRWLNKTRRGSSEAMLRCECSIGSQPHPPSSYKSPHPSLHNLSIAWTHQTHHQYLKKKDWSTLKGRLKIKTVTTLKHEYFGLLCVSMFFVIYQHIYFFINIMHSILIKFLAVYVMIIWLHLVTFLHAL